MSDYEYLQAWGGRHQFMASYGLKPEPSGYEESQAIMAALRDQQARAYAIRGSYYSARTAARSSCAPPAVPAQNEARSSYPTGGSWW